VLPSLEQQRRSDNPKRPAGSRNPGRKEETRLKARLKATGIVWRIDDLGRVVIPKEIRRTLKIREGDPLEIFVGRDGEVILKKYSPITDAEA
jgi:AbrB family transcriptional regulator (stage V sporulation protein T)